MDHKEVLVPQGRQHTAQGKAEKAGFIPHRRAEQKVGRQQQKAAAEGQGHKVARRLEFLDVLRCGKLEGRDVAAVVVDVIGILNDEFYLAVGAGKKGNGHVAHPGHKAFLCFGHLPVFRRLHPVHKDAGGIVRRETADRVILVGPGQDAQPVGAAGPVGGGCVLGGLAHGPCREVRRVIQSAGVEFPLPVHCVDIGGDIQPADVQNAVLHGYILCGGRAPEEGRRQSRQAASDHHDRQKPVGRFAHNVLEAHGTSSFPPL